VNEALALIPGADLTPDEKSTLQRAAREKIKGG
jgi:hypothetical protein